MVLRTTKFFGLCYADELAEREFFAKNFKAIVQERLLILSFEWVRGLDLIKIKSQLTAYDFFEIEDVYLRDKLIAFVKENSEYKKLSLNIGAQHTFIKHLKFTSKGFVIQLVK